MGPEGFRWHRVDNPAVRWDPPGCLAFSSWGVFRPSLCNDRCQGRVQAELGSLFMRQSTWLWKNVLHFLLAVFPFGNMAHYFLLASYLAVTRPVSGCCQ